MAWAQAQELRPHRCRAAIVTPGWLRSEQMLDNYGVSEANWRDAIGKQPHFIITETPRYAAARLRTLLQIQMSSAGADRRFRAATLPSLWLHRDLDGSQPDAWRYVVEVQDAGRPADATGYR